jgi:PEP-CTERM motif
MLKTRLLVSAAAVVASLGMASAASATTWEAYVEENYTGNVASVAAYEAGQASAVYIGDVSNVNFNSDGSVDYTIGSWLGTGGFNYTGPLANDTVDNTLWLFYTDQTFQNAPTLTVTHDDGIEVPYNNINGPTYIGFTAGPTSAITETGTCPACSGPGQVGIVYNEADGAPSVLTVDSVSVPEPSTWALMLLGFGGLGVAMRRSRGMAATV